MDGENHGSKAYFQMDDLGGPPLFLETAICREAHWESTWRLINDAPPPSCGCHPSPAKSVLGGAQDPIKMNLLQSVDNFFKAAGC